MAVATLTARRHAEKALRDRGLFAYFDCMLTIEDVGVPKYEPDIYLETARRLGVPPEEQGQIILDYSIYDAHRAGFRVCGVAERAYARGEGALRAASDWFIEASFDELREKLQYFG